MATKTISLELDAYEYLLNQKQGGESFSAVVRRARFPSETTAVSDPPASYVSGRRRARQPEALIDEVQSADAMESFEAASGRQKLRDKARRGKGSPSPRGWTRDELYGLRGGGR